MTDNIDCSTCGKTLSDEDSAVEVFNPSVVDDSIVCTRCAKRAGVAVGTFAQPVSDLLE